MSRPTVSILIPSFRTPDLTRLCLRLLNKHTRREEIQVVVIDNDSRDESVEYLRSLRWIRLIERQRVAGELPAQAHSRALDLALEQVGTPYVLSMHTDTLVRDAGWLHYLLDRLTSRPEIAGVGSWKLEAKSIYKVVAKRTESCLQSLIGSFTRRADERVGTDPRGARYLRSHCALYRTDLIRRYGLSFSRGGESAGKALHRTLLEKGHEMLFLPPATLMRYVLHLNHATMVLNPELGARQRTIRAGRSRLARMMALVEAERVLADDRLDR